MCMMFDLGKTLHLSRTRYRKQRQWVPSAPQQRKKRSQHLSFLDTKRQDQWYFVLENLLVSRFSFHLLVFLKPLQARVFWGQQCRSRRNCLLLYHFQFRGFQQTVFVPAMWKYFRKFLDTSNHPPSVHFSDSAVLITISTALAVSRSVNNFASTLTNVLHDCPSLSAISF